MKILGIDFGLKKIGLAISEGTLAEPLIVIRNQPSIIKKIVSLCRQYGIQKLVVGIPEGKLARKTRHFGERLSQKAQLPVIYQDETLTTKDAVAKMIKAGKKRKYRQKKEDAFAASLILQEYLDRLNRR